MVSAGCHVVPSAEVSTRGPGPTASHPCGPWVTADNPARSGPADTWSSEETRGQGPARPPPPHRRVAVRAADGDLLVPVDGGALHRFLGDEAARDGAQRD